MFSMKLSERILVLAAATLLIASPLASHAYAQQGNGIEGFVFGYERRPVADMYVELYDDFGRTLGRQRTNNAGAFSFEGLRPGNFVVRVLTAGTDYEEREERVEIYNLTERDRDTKNVVIYLRLKRGATPPNAEPVFAQDVPAEAQRRFEKGVADLDAKRQADGLKELRSAIEAFPKYYAALERLGIEYLQIGRPDTVEAARILLEVAVGVNPRAFRSWYGLARARLLQNAPDEALKAAEKAAELKPNSADAVFLQGRILRGLKKYPEAEKHLVKAKEIAGTPTAEMHWELALLYGNNLKLYSEAAKELTLYLKVNPEASNAENVKKLIAEFESKAKKPN
jgi:tetratricopeptide (TPR) repeat protein